MSINKSKKSTAVITIILGILIIVGFIVYAFIRDANTPKYYNSSKTKIGEKLYEELSTIDFKNDYPNTPEDVIEINNKVMTMFYGNILLNNDKLDELVNIQRNLFSEELKELNSVDAQVINISNNIKELLKDDIYIIDIKSGSVRYISRNDNSCSVIIKIYVTRAEKFEMKYYLNKDSNNHWKISGWEVLDNQTN